MADRDPILLTAGPAGIRIVGESGVAPTAGTLAACEAIDDPVILVDGRPAPVAGLLRAVAAEVLAAHRARMPAGTVPRVTVVHPSWWPRPRTARVVRALAATATVVAVLPRSEVLRRQNGGDLTDPVVIEVAAEVVAISGRGPLRLCDRGDLAGIAAHAARAGGGAVLIDAPAEIPGAAETADVIRNMLSASGIRCQVVEIRAVAAEPASPTPLERGRRIPANPAAALGLAVLGLAVLGLAAVAAVVPVAAGPRFGSLAAAPVTGTPVTLVQDRVAVEIPPDWPVRQVTDGPGSRRVEVSSPVDDRAVLHITSAYAPGATLAAAAQALGRAAAADPEVFVDFRPADRVAGRPALTYREIRPGRVVSWSVVLDGSMRIAIGCQSAPGREESVATICEAALSSAREFVGTVSAPGASK